MYEVPMQNKRRWISKGSSAKAGETIERAWIILVEKQQMIRLHYSLVGLLYFRGRPHSYSFVASISHHYYTIPMQPINYVISLLTGKIGKATVLPTEALSPTEMEHLFGGKPDQVISEHAYWWIEDEQALAPEAKLDSYACS
jgi:hypothetical protein